MIRNVIGILVLLAASNTVSAQPDGGPDAAVTAQPPDGGIAWRTVDAGDLAEADASAGDAGAAVASATADLLPEELRPTIRVSVAPESGLVTGDIVTLTIEVDAAEGDEVNLPRQDFSPFDLFDSGSEQEDDSSRIVFTLQLLAFEPGQHEVGPIRLRVLTADGTLGAVLTDPVAVEVGSLLGNEPDADLKPPSEPVQVLEEDYTLAWILGSIGALLIVALIAFFVARWWLKREKAAEPPPPPRPAWEIAIEELDELKVTLSDRVAEGDAEPWADELSDVVRHYLGERYEFEGLESTSDEIHTKLTKLKPRGIQVAEVSALLGDCDLVKFARAEATGEHCQELLGAAYRIVRATTPARSFAEQNKSSAKGSPGGAR